MPRDWPPPHSLSLTDTLLFIRGSDETLKHDEPRFIQVSWAVWASSTVHSPHPPRPPRRSVSTGWPAGEARATLAMHCWLPLPLRRWLAAGCAVVGPELFTRQQSSDEAPGAAIRVFPWRLNSGALDLDRVYSSDGGKTPAHTLLPSFSLSLVIFLRSSRRSVTY
jgi:hypothetical protein